MRAYAFAAVVYAFAAPAYAQNVVCNPLCSQQSSSSTASSSSQASTRSRSTATGAIAGSQVNAPVTSTSRGGSANVVVVNRVSGGGGYHGRSGSSGATGAVAADPPPADPGPVLGSAGNPLTENIGGTTTIRNVPEIVAPNVSGGNPCLIGASGGVAVAGLGVTLGGGWTDKGCERRNSAALLNNMGDKAAALELMCDDDHVRAALLRSGQPCAADRARAAAVQSVQTAAQGPIDPAVVRRQQASAAPLPPAHKPAKPDWCGVASADELRHHPQCD